MVKELWCERAAFTCCKFKIKEMFLVVTFLAVSAIFVLAVLLGASTSFIQTTCWITSLNQTAYACGTQEKCSAEPILFSDARDATLNCNSAQDTCYRYNGTFTYLKADQKSQQTLEFRTTCAGFNCRDNYYLGNSRLCFYNPKDPSMVSFDDVRGNARGILAGVLVGFAVLWIFILIVSMCCPCCPCIKVTVGIYSYLNLNSDYKQDGGISYASPPASAPASRKPVMESDNEDSDDDATSEANEDPEPNSLKRSTSKTETPENKLKSQPEWSTWRGRTSEGGVWTPSSNWSSERV